GRVAETVGMAIVAGEEEEADVLEGVGGEDDDVGVLKAAAAVGVEVFDAGGSALRVRDDSEDAAVGSQVEVAGGQRFRNGSEGGVPLVAVAGAKAVAPGTVGGGGVTVVGHTVDADGGGMRVETEGIGAPPEHLAEAEWAERGHGQGFRASDERIGFVPGDAN